MDPAFLAPDGERLTGVQAEKVEFGVVPVMTEIGVFEPSSRKLLLTIGQIFAAKNSQSQHFGRCEFRIKFRVKVPAHRLGQGIDIMLLHQVVDDDLFLPHK